MWPINLAVMNFNFDFLRNDTNGVFDKVLYHKVSCLFISSEPCLFIIKLWNNVPLPCNSQEVMKWMMFWPEVNFKGKNDPLGWIAFKQIAKKKKKKKKKKGLKKFGPHLEPDASKFPSGQLITGTGIQLNLVKS